VVAPSIKTVALEAKAIQDMEEYQDSLVGMKLEVGNQDLEVAAFHVKVYTKHKLAELLAKIADASLELLNSKLDPWGYPITV